MVHSCQFCPYIQTKINFCFCSPVTSIKRAFLSNLKLNFFQSTVRQEDNGTCLFGDFATLYPALWSGFQRPLFSFYWVWMQKGFSKQENFLLYNFFRLTKFLAFEALQSALQFSIVHRIRIRANWICSKCFF
jgi:hypothetical protein